MSYFEANFTLDLVTASVTNFTFFDPDAGKIQFKPHSPEFVGNHTVEIVLSWLDEFFDEWRFSKELNLTVIQVKEIEIAFEIEVECPK